MDWFKYDFGYDWPWTFGHLILFAVFGTLTLIAWRRRSVWSTLLLSFVALWAATGVVITHAVLDFSRVPKLPTENFLAPATGKVLDAGAGSGRSTLMVLLARPRAQVIAVDIFSSDFGISDNTPERLLRNAERAGVADRVEVRRGDMRELPLATDSLDAAISSFAIDHLPEQGIAKALIEIRRTLKPGGEFLMSTIRADRYIRIAYPLMTEHGYFGNRDTLAQWTRLFQEAGFKILEVGTRPGTLYFLVQSPD